MVVAGGGAYAAFDPVGGDGDIDACFEKKSGDLDLLKGKKCGKKEKPVTWSQAGPQGEPGQQGPKGDTGSQGPRGLSSYDAIPAGQTVTGFERFDVETGRANGNFQFAVDLPALAPVAITNEAANFAPSGVVLDGDATCTGTVATPTAPAGKFCGYLAKISVNSGDVSASAFEVGPRREGVRVAFTGVAANSDAYVEFAWAYTAP